MRLQRTGNTRPFLNSVLYELDNGWWEDEHGTLMALRDPKLAVDETDQAGVGWFVLPKSHFLSQAAPMHDFMFTCPVYQAFHAMVEANEHYLRNARILGEEAALKAFWVSLADLALKHASHWFWDNKQTIEKPGRLPDGRTDEEPNE